ncbi:JmjC domain [Cinara cedri]|uniref:JmjC domain n=1 Tax=Cinara cedri TaxID=506608 RepID=A0A5E4MZW3_9HEMI|nr:JmjC domain [Cinara cedri]
MALRHTAEASIVSERADGVTADMADATPSKAVATTGSRRGRRTATMSSGGGGSGGPRSRRSPLSAVVLSAVAIAFAATVDWRHAATECGRWLTTAAELFSSATDQKCAVTLPDFLEDVLRPPIDCTYCKGMDSVEKIFNLSAENFEKNYAYTGRPVVAVDVSGPSTTTFGFRLFKNLSDSGLMTPCQFFPYKTEFRTLSEALGMDERRAAMEPGQPPWYVGWSNCEPKTINRLKRHVSLPNFLPALSDSKRTLWIFMGTPGHGAPMHIDKVGYPSWQTQISGHKKWTLRTPVECFFKCKRQFEVFMEPGSTIVLDTNIWYHETQTIGQNISITVGGEYD